MLTDLLFYVFLLILPVVLWLIPKTRHQNGNWLIALKMVPPGILVFFLIDKLVLKTQFLLSEWMEIPIIIPFWIRFTIPLIAAFLIIIFGGLFIKRKFGAEKKYNPGPSILLFIILMPPAVIAYSVISFASIIITRDYKGEWRSSWLPPEGNTRIAFQQQSIHPFLAEYNYRLRFTRDGQKFYQMLFTNCGGRTHFNIYRLKDGRFLFRDKDWDYLVDVPKQQVFRLASFEDRLYAALVPNEEINSWSGPQRKKGKIVMNMGKHTVPADDVTGVLEGMTYYGCILTRFYPASQKPEMNITKTEIRMKAHQMRIKQKNDPKKTH